MSHQDMSSLKWLSGTRIQNQGAEEPGKPGKRMASEVGRQNSSLQEYGLEDRSLQMFLGSFFLMESAVPSFLRAASSYWLHICQYSTYTLQTPPFCTLSGIYRTYTERSLGARNGAKNRILISFHLHNGL